MSECLLHRGQEFPMIQISSSSDDNILSNEMSLVVILDVILCDVDQIFTNTSHRLTHIMISVGSVMNGFNYGSMLIFLINGVSVECILLSFNLWGIVEWAGENFSQKSNSFFSLTWKETKRVGLEFTCCVGCEHSTKLINSLLNLFTRMWCCSLRNIFVYLIPSSSTSPGIERHHYSPGFHILIQLLGPLWH